jgi:hypothetical protein
VLQQPPSQVLWCPVHPAPNDAESSRQQHPLFFDPSLPRPLRVEVSCQQPATWNNKTRQSDCKGSSSSSISWLLHVGGWCHTHGLWRYGFAAGDVVVAAGSGCGACHVCRQQCTVLPALYHCCCCRMLLLRPTLDLCCCQQVWHAAVQAWSTAIGPGARLQHLALLLLLLRCRWGLVTCCTCPPSGGTTCSSKLTQMRAGAWQSTTGEAPPLLPLLLHACHHCTHPPSIQCHVMVCCHGACIALQRCTKNAFNALNP